MLLLACAPDLRAVPEARSHARTWVPAADQDAQLVPLDAPRLLRRMSLDLRGTLPSAAELDTVETDPSAIDAIRDAYLDDPAFEERFVSMLGQRWLTEVDEYLIQYVEFPNVADDPTNEYPWERAVGQEPLRLMARIAAEDRPWTDVVTADTTMADEMLAGSWPVAYPDGASGWREVRYTDGRPAAGVLSTNGLWWRYYTTFTNYNRMRVGALARLLLCVDYLSRPVSFSGSASLADADGVSEALRTDPNCLGCHASIDPIAASFFGFWTPQPYNGTETVTYHPERELLGEALLDVTPAWYGRPVSGLADLGQHVAADPRFTTCAVKSAAEMYLHRDATVDDFDRLEDFRHAYLDGGERMKPLIAAVTDSASYRAGGLAEGVTAPTTEESTSRLMDVTLMGSVLEDLVGFTWTSAGFDQLRNDTYGFRVLGGGVDGAYVTRPQRLPGLTWVEVTARVAEAAGVYVAEEVGSGLLDGVTVDDGSDSPAFDAQVRALRWRLLAVRATDDDVAEDAALFDAAGGAETGWAALLQSWFRDPAFVSW